MPQAIEDRIEALIQSGELCIVRWDWLGTCTERERVGRFTDLTNVVAQLTSGWVNGQLDPILIHA